MVGSALSSTIPPVTQQPGSTCAVSLKPPPERVTDAGLEMLKDMTQPSPLTAIQGLKPERYRLKKRRSVPGVVSPALTPHGLAPLLQNSVRGDGHGYPEALRPVTAELAVPLITLEVMGI